MKHCIIAKYTAEAYARWETLLPRIREIFSAAGDIPGVRGAEVFPNCVARDNRYDVMIVLEMDRDALEEYDRSAMHHRWKKRRLSLTMSKNKPSGVSRRRHKNNDIISGCRKSQRLFRQPEKSRAHA